MWSDREQRKQLTESGFSYRTENRGSGKLYTMTTPWVESRRRRWMLSVPQRIRVAAIGQHLDSRKNFFDSISGKRKGPPVGPPKFASRKETRFRVQLQNQFLVTQTRELDDGRIVRASYLKLPSARGVPMGVIRCLENPSDRFYGGQVHAVTIKKDVDRWYAVFHIHKIPPPQIPFGRKDESIGVDLNTGIHGIVLSTGKKFPVPPELEDLHRRIQHHQRTHRRKRGPNRRSGVSPSGHWLKQKDQLAKLHRKTRRLREDWLHKITSWLAANYRVVVIEDLHPRTMTRSAKGTVDSPGKGVRSKAGLNRVILQAAFGRFRELLTYKMQQYGGQLVVVDQWFPSSQICNRCGWRPAVSLGLGVRVYQCKNCGLSENRDRNAARNLRRVYEDSLAAAAAGNAGEERRDSPWTGAPLESGDFLLIEVPRRKREGALDDACMGGLGQPDGGLSCSVPQEKRAPSAGSSPTRKCADTRSRGARKKGNGSRQKARAGCHGDKTQDDGE